MSLDWFFEKFELIAETTNAVAHMRKLVLTLAVHGKLVPQYIDDEPAETLLSRLGLTSTACSPDCSGAEDNSLPATWSRVRFEDLAIVAGGVTLGRKLAERKTVTLPYLRVANVKRGELDLTIIKEVSIAEDEIDRYALRENDLLMTEGGDWDKVGRAAIWRGAIPLCLHQNHVFRARMRSAELAPHWCELYFNSPEGRSYFEAASKQTTNLASINMRQVRSCPIPLPPLAEQKRIVAKVDELMALCDQLEAQQQEREARKSVLARAALSRFAAAPTPANLNLLFHPSYTIPPSELRKTILTLAVRGKLVPQDPKDEPVNELIQRVAKIRHTKNAKQYEPVSPEQAPFEIPFSWSWVRLGNLSLTSDSGWSPQCLPEARTGNDWGVLKVSAVSWGVFKPHENKALPPGMSGRPDCEVKPGDFLLSRANTEELIARSVVVDKTPRRLMMSDKIVRFTFPDQIERAYINLANTSDPSRAYYAYNSAGTSSSMKNIGRDVMCNLPIPLPPLAEQRRIVAKVEQLMSLVDALEEQRESSRVAATKLLTALVAELTEAQTR